MRELKTACQSNLCVAVDPQAVIEADTVNVKRPYVNTCLWYTTDAETLTGWSRGSKRVKIYCTFGNSTEDKSLGHPTTQSRRSAGVEKLKSH